MPGEITETVTRFHENRLCACVEGEFHVAVAIADHERTLQVDAKFPRGAMQHAGARLAAIAGARFIVRTIINRIEVRAGLGQFPFHPLVDIVQQRLRKIAAGHAGLIGDHDHGDTRLIETADGLGRKRKHTKSVEMIQVADFFGDCAVAIEEYGGPEGGGVRQKAPPRALSAARIRPSRA